MSKRQPKPEKSVPPQMQASPTAELLAALTRQKKASLVEVLVDLAQRDRGVLRELTARFQVATVPNELVAATRQAIADATGFDMRDINRNFDYDYEAYNEVKRNLGRLIDAGLLQSAMELALELMKHGSQQVEMSDEGLMTEDIESCLNVVFEALRKSDLPAAEALTWCSAMLENDRVGFIAREPLESLRKQLQKSAAR
jgi:uncharacterized Zn finger protein